MNTPRVSWRFAALLLAALHCASIPHAPAGDLDLATPEDVLTAGPWKISYEKGAWSIVRNFDRNGTFFTPGRPDETGRWKITGDSVIQTFADGRKDVLALPLDPQGTAGVARDGQAMSAVRIIGMPAPAPTPVQELGELEKAAAVTVLISGPWKMAAGAWSAILVFASEGTFATPGNSGEHGHWKIADGMVILTFADGHKDCLILPLDPKGTAAALQDGQPATAVVVDASAAEPPKASGAVPTPAAPRSPTPQRVTAMSEEDRVAATALLVSGPWKFSGAGWSAVRVFDKNGTFTTVDQPDIHGRWKISNNIVTLAFSDGHKDTLLLPLDPKKTAGVDAFGRPTTAVLAAAPAAGGKPTPAPAAAVARPAPASQAPAPDEQPKDPTVVLLTSGPWKISTKAGSDVRVFKADGTFTTVGKPDANGRWTVTSDLVILIFPNEHKDALMLPLNPKGTAGLADDGTAMEAILMDAAAVPGAPTPPPAPAILSAPAPFGNGQQ